MKVVLELLDQPSNIRRITVRHDIVIGRGADCNLRLSAPQVSRRHCFLRVGRDTVSVTDLDSSNGTYVDGVRIESGKRHEVADSMTLALGPIRFVVSVRHEAVAPELVPGREVNDSINVPPNALRESGSTVMEVEPPPGGTDAVRATEFRYAIETGGASAEEHEPTADMAESEIDDLSMDSEAEIVDLGRRMAELERSQRFAARNDTRQTSADSDDLDFSDEDPGFKD